MREIVKLIIFIVGGGLCGAVLALLFFIDESSTSRLVPGWGIFFITASTVAGASVTGWVYYQLLFCDHKGSH